MVEKRVEIVPGYVIREAVAEEMGRVGEIARQAWAPIHQVYAQDVGEEMHGSLCANWAPEKEAAVRGHWERHPEWFRVVECVENGEVVAFVTFRMDNEKLLGILTNNAVAPEVQGKGIGTAMYTHVLDLFRKQGLRYASVGTGLDEGHAPARRAYEKVGFNLKREQVTYYQYL
ncbi:MAG: GNAT family N-acetyltransferase [bacterium]|nr:GNAT family N-acetyltransferase [bacterium]